MKPYFMWDYDMTEADVHQLLRTGSDDEKRWLIARILEHAHFRDVFQWLMIQDIVTFFSQLKLRPITKQYWQRALTAWGYHV